MAKTVEEHERAISKVLSPSYHLGNTKGQVLQTMKK